ncbi:O-antigen ligase family protein [Croceiramulus getboli]|nr:O-antigen ligase family protein [Flavobacteriaceae bacterium YJPT1-3]
MEERKINYFEIILILLLSLAVFRIPATALLFVFVAFNVGQYKQLQYGKWQWICIAIIAAPLLLDILFFWNNTDWLEGIKHGEKRLALFLVPLFLIGRKPAIRWLYILRGYSLIFTLVLIGCLGWFALAKSEFFVKYLAGRELWEMGYVFAKSLRSHAPALNLHIAFLVVVNFFLLAQAYWKKHKALLIGGRLLLFVVSAFMLLFVNTRLAIVNALLGILLILVFYLWKASSSRKALNLAFISLAICAGLFFAFAKAFPHILEKYSTVTFAHMDKVGRLDEIDRPEVTVYNALVTRVSIWKSASEVARNNLPWGTGAADGKEALNQYYEDSNQQFLATYDFPAHNQFLDFSIKFGFLGLMVALLFMSFPAYLGIQLRDPLVLFFFWNFLTANLVDDFLIRFDGIVFSALWMSLFAHRWLHQSGGRARSTV